MNYWRVACSYFVMSDSELDDEQLIRRVLAGEHDLYRVLVNRYKDLVFAMIVRQIGSHQISEELAHEVFVKVYRNLRSFRGEAKFSSWVVRIALNHCSSYFSSRAYKQQRKNEDLSAAESYEASSSPEREYQSKELKESLRECITRLKPIFREVITVCALESESYEVAAKMFNVPVGTIRSRLNKARLHLRECLHQRGVYG